MRGRAWRTAAAAAAVGTAIALVPAGGDTPAAAQPGPVGFLRVGGAAGPDRLPQIVDQAGRAVLLRGVNVAGLGDYWQPNLEPPYPVDPAAYANGACPPDNTAVEPPPVCQYDFAQLPTLGYDTIRLTISWSLLEPNPGQVSTTYLDRIAQVVSWARQAGIRVIVDMHEDAWSKYVFTPPGQTCPPPFGPIRGYDGAPAWATTHVTPACAADGIRELDPQVAENAQRFLADAPGPNGIGLQEYFAQAFTALAATFKDDPTVVGYDVLNEPHPGFAPLADSTTELFRLYAKVVTAVTGHVRGFRQLFFLEPDATRNVTATPQPLLPWSLYSSYRNVVYAPHIYTGVFTWDQEATGHRVITAAQDYDGAVTDARTLGTPLWVGEFGCNRPDDATLLAASYAQQDADDVGGTLWIWKENANDVTSSVNWSVYAPPFPPGTPVPDRVLLTARPYPVALAGELTRLVADPAHGSFQLSATSRRVRPGDTNHATLVYLPWSVSGPLQVDGATATIAGHVGGGRDVWLYPTGGPYSLTVGAT